MDIYRQYVSTDRAESHYVTVGRVAAFAAMVIALVLARPFLGGMESAFQTIQEYTGFIAPGVVTIFLLGFFYQRANEASAYAVLIASVVASIVLKIMFPDVPFVLRIWMIFILITILGIVVSHLTAAPSDDQPVALGDIEFGTTQGFNVAAGIITLLLALIYVAFW